LIRQRLDACWIVRQLVRIVAQTEDDGCAGFGDFDEAVKALLRGKCDNPPEFWLLMAEVLVGDGVRLLVETDED